MEKTIKELKKEVKELKYLKDTYYSNWIGEEENHKKTTSKLENYQNLHILNFTLKDIVEELKTIKAIAIILFISYIGLKLFNWI